MKIESQVEYKEFAFDAVGFPIIAYDDYNNSVERERHENSGKCLRPCVFEASKTLAILIDISNTVLDYILVVNLSLMGEHGYAALLGFMTSLSLLVSIWMKFLMYRMRKDEIMQPEFILQFVLVTEFFIFAFENVTAVLILTRVDEDGEFLVDRSEIFGANLNLWTTIFSGVCVGLLMIINISLKLFDISKDDRCHGAEIGGIAAMFYGMFYISYIIYFAINKVLLENPMKDEEGLKLKSAYILHMVLSLVLFLLSNVIVITMFMFSGGN